MARLAGAFCTRLFAAAAASIVLTGMLSPVAYAAGAYPMGRQTVSVDGEDRSYSYFISSKANRSTFQFVVFALHDNGQTVDQFAERSGWLKLAEDNGFAVVFPEAGRGGWAPTSGGEDAYLKAVFDHARTHLILVGPDGAPLAPPPRGGVRGEGGEGGGRGGNPNRVPSWAPWYYLTGAGAGGTAAQEFAIDYPGLFAAVATQNAAPYDAAFAKGDQPAQGYFQYMRAGKNAAPTWKQLKKDVPLAVWIFNSGPPSRSQVKETDYWKRSNAVAAAPAARTIDGMQTAVFSNAANPSQQVRVTTTPRAYDAALTATIWNDFFDHLARWTSSANGDVGSKLTHAEVDKTFDVKTIDVGGGQQPYTYYVKTPSTYRPGQHLPVVISAHGANFPAWLYLSQIKMHELGEREGFITVYPNAHNNMWDFTRPDGGDQKFIRQIVADVIRDYGVDPTRVYMQGFSFGSGMTYMMGISYPGLFAAVSPNNGIGPMSKEVNAWVDGLKAKGDIRIPMMIVYGAVDSGASVDATIPAQGVLRDAIDQIKTYNHISTPDRYVRFDSLNSAPYDMLVPGPKLEPAAVDARYPAGRFQVYKYASADPKPLSLFQFVWVTDLPHGADLREAKLEWDYFKHWRRNADGSLAFIP